MLDGKEVFNLKETIKEFTLELSRIALVAVLPILITSVESGNVDYKIIATVAVVAVLKAVDRALHESGVAEKGLTRF